MQGRLNVLFFSKRKGLTNREGTLCACVCRCAYACVASENQASDLGLTFEPRSYLFSALAFPTKFTENVLIIDNKV